MSPRVASPLLLAALLVAAGVLLGAAAGRAPAGAPLGARCGGWAQQRLRLASAHSLSVRPIGFDGDLCALRPDQPRRIASVSKLFTAATAIQLLAPGYRFRTEFYADGVIGPSVENLYLKGYGDPFLVSEEWRLIATALPALEIRGDIVVDDTFFAAELDLIREPGVSNPYNARNAAFATNFNTLEVTVRGQEVRGEPQTPLTSFTHFKLHPGLRGFIHVDTRQEDARLVVDIRGPFKQRDHTLRFNLGSDPRTPGLYAGHLFRAIFIEAGGAVLGGVRRGAVPADAELLYQHQGTRPLAQVAQGLFEYSNNFVANQVFLTMGAEISGPPAEPDKSRALLQREVDGVIGAGAVTLVEGSGLDPRNRATAAAITRYLDAVYRRLPGFAALLPRRADERIAAKTGTYVDNGVRAMAGYLLDPEGIPIASFALLCDSRRCPASSFDRYDKLLREIAAALEKPLGPAGSAAAPVGHEE